MASETLDDITTPSLPDNKVDDHQPNETESAHEQQPKPNEPEQEYAEVAEQGDSIEVDESKDDTVDEKKEIDEGVDSEKNEDAEEEEKKEAVSEKKSPVTPTSERPTRERKTVERYSEPSPFSLGRSSSSKGLVIEKGSGTQLKDIPNVAFKLSKRKADDNLHILHSILFGKKTKAHNLKKNIGQFSGYVWAENEEKQRAKIKERIDKCVKEKLIVFCDVLNIPINKGSVKKEELSTKLLEFLESPHVTTDVLLAEKDQKAKKRTRKATPSKSPGEASTETPAKKKQTPQSGKKRKQSTDVEEDDKAELSDAKDDSQEDDVAGEDNESDDEVGKSEEEEDASKSQKSTSKKSVKEDSVAKAGAKTPSAKKTSAKASKSSEKSPKSPIPKKSVTEHESASISKSKQSATKKQKTGNEKQDTKGKAASKTSKEPVKDQVKGKSSKKTKGEPSRADMHQVVVNILKEVDFNTATLSDILRQLGTHFGLDLMHRKAEVKDIITDVINNMSDEEDEGEDADNDGDGDGDDGKDGDVSNEDDAE